MNTLLFLILMTGVCWGDGWDEQCLNDGGVIHTCPDNQGKTCCRGRLPCMCVNANNGDTWEWKKNEHNKIVIDHPLKADSIKILTNTHMVIDATPEEKLKVSCQDDYYLKYSILEKRHPAPKECDGDEFTYKGCDQDIVYSFLSRKMVGLEIKCVKENQ